MAIPDITDHELIEEINDKDHAEFEEYCGSVEAEEEAQAEYDATRARDEYDRRKVPLWASDWHDNNPDAWYDD